VLHCHRPEEALADGLVPSIRAVLVGTAPCQDAHICMELGTMNGSHKLSDALEQQRIQRKNR
jgi:hypothetical protein